jgi:hypothetical protein
MLARGADINIPNLPPKTEVILFCPFTDIQVVITYKKILPFDHALILVDTNTIIVIFI